MTQRQRRKRQRSVPIKQVIQRLSQLFLTFVVDEVCN